MKDALSPSLPTSPPQANQPHIYPSVKRQQGKRGKDRGRKVQGKRAQPFNTSSIIQPPIPQLVEPRCPADGLQQELLPTPAQVPTLGKYLHGFNKKTGYQLMVHGMSNWVESTVRIKKKSEKEKKKKRPRRKIRNLILSTPMVQNTSLQVLPTASACRESDEEK